ncbi:MAG: DEAD/DEAH box helicase family protein [Ignavibacteriaceae bacterium]|nr:DEAD/DEAH box helicase family protein [Ignavibacteriaceae bacterium]
MNPKANYIKQRLSLRDPLKESLDILVRITDAVSMKKNVSPEEELSVIKSLYPSCTNFERDFPSVCFSIATGVGKTRLMGACIAYLYMQKGIRNFFVLAPNLTIYDKLIKDFGDPNNPKYVFKGISEFVHNTPLIITGDNYNQAGGLFSNDEIRINIFNIAKFNSENRATRSGGQSLPPRIKRLSEYLGKSYWDYLSGLDDLVILMDEAHRYHADASKNAINELKPVFGVELTATPIDEKGNSFSNVVYEYSLAKALDDGKYVKNPAIATRKNFSALGLSPEEIERIKLEDAVSVHRDTKNELEIYALNNNVKKVKPFILVVCKDINHAKETFDYVSSDAFYDGAYKGKVLQIDSSTKREEEIERLFVDLEQYENEIELVIHVNMLKEGWDVNNLYTIVPLRAANAAVLIEQTIGRGLRLPYNGERTGVEKVDKLTVIAHDNFEKVIAAAQDPNSVLNKLSYIEIQEEEIKQDTEVITSVSKISAAIIEEEKKISKITDEKERQIATNSLDAKRLIVHTLPDFGSVEGVRKAEDLRKPEIKEKVISRIEETLFSGHRDLFADDVVREAEILYESVVTSFISNTIEIPRMDLVQGDVKVWFDDFDLDTSSGFDFQVLSEEIMVVELTGERKTNTIGVEYGAFSKNTPVNQILSELINYPEIDYDENAELLYKLSKQALRYLHSKLPEKDKLSLLIRQYRKYIAAKIYQQMKAHFHVGKPDYIEPRVLPFVRIEDWNFTGLKDGRRHFKDVVNPKSLIPKLVFSGFEKACHFEYKFQSGTEKDFAYILENDGSVIKWLRPAPNQFRIYWANNSKQYYPDFVVETSDCIYIVETKEAGEMNSEEVLDKKRAALEYCKHASNYTSKHGGKPWKYLLVPHDQVSITNSFEFYTQI